MSSGDRDPLRRDQFGQRMAIMFHELRTGHADLVCEARGTAPNIQASVTGS